MLRLQARIVTGCRLRKPTAVTFRKQHAIRNTFTARSPLCFSPSQRLLHSICRRNSTSEQTYSNRQTPADDATKNDQTQAPDPELPTQGPAEPQHPDHPVTNPHMKDKAGRVKWDTVLKKQLAKIDDVEMQRQNPYLDPYYDKSFLDILSSPQTSYADPLVHQRLRRTVIRYWYPPLVFLTLILGYFVSNILRKAPVSEEDVKLFAKHFKQAYGYEHGLPFDQLFALRMKYGKSADDNGEMTIEAFEAFHERELHAKLTLMKKDLAAIYASPNGKVNFRSFMTGYLLLHLANNAMPLSVRLEAFTDLNYLIMDKKRKGSVSLDEVTEWVYFALDHEYIPTRLLRSPNLLVKSPEGIARYIWRAYSNPANPDNKESYYDEGLTRNGFKQFMASFWEDIKPKPEINVGEPDKTKSPNAPENARYSPSEYYSIAFQAQELKDRIDESRRPNGGSPALQ